MSKADGDKVFKKYRDKYNLTHDYVSPIDARVALSEALQELEQEMLEEQIDWLYNFVSTIPRDSYVGTIGQRIQELKDKINENKG